MVVTKKSIIGDILDYDSGTAEFFFEIGMHCLGCPASRGESVEDACAVHGTDADALVASKIVIGIFRCLLIDLTISVLPHPDGPKISIFDFKPS